MPGAPYIERAKKHANISASWVWYAAHSRIMENRNGGTMDMWAVTAQSWSTMRANKPTDQSTLLYIGLRPSGVSVLWWIGVPPFGGVCDVAIRPYLLRICSARSHMQHPI